MGSSRKLLWSITIILIITAIIVMGEGVYTSLTRIRHNMHGRVIELSDSIYQALNIIMLSGKGHSIDEYLDNIRKIKTIQDIRIVRASAQFPLGPNKSNSPATDLEKQVLSSGREVDSDIKVGGKRGIQRIMPVVVKKECLSCHTHVKEGEVIAAITTTISYQSNFDEIIHDFWGICLILILASIIVIVTIKRFVQKQANQLWEAQMELERAKHLSDIGVLAATVAHELRNPLAAIVLAAHNIKRKVKSPDIDKHLVNIDKKVTESDRIINNLLFYSRLGPPRYEKVNIFDLLEECAGTIKTQSGKETMVIRKLDSIKGILIEADPIQIKEIFHNLLNNANDAVPSENGQIKIMAENEDGFVQVTIEDNGTGIDKDVLVKLFQPFFTTKAKGTGLGLSVCRQIVNMHKGEIGIKSSPGSGTSVIVRLPKERGK